MLDLCISNRLRFLNGRVLGDSFGQYTCYTPNGASVVDYVLVSDDILEQILRFKINYFDPTFSETHCRLEWTISAEYSIFQSSNNMSTKPISPNFIWTNESSFKLQQALTMNESKEKLTKFNERTIDNSQESIDEAAKELSDLILSAAKVSLKRNINTNNSRRKKYNKKWFDNDLKKLYWNLMNYSKTFTKFPKDIAVRNHFYKLRREYNKLRKYKQRQYRQSILNQLESLHENNPKQYWNLINDLKQNNDKNQVSSAVDPSTWVTHFQNLNQIKSNFKQRLQRLQEQLEALQNVKVFNELDAHISTDEISKAILKLKTNKSPGLDNISSNMLKCGQAVLIPSFYKLFNACLTTGNYPRNWATSYITPIHKCGDVTDPNNYRGITVTSAIGKLFNCIMNERLDSFLEKYQIINKCQVGFTKKARTADHLFILKCILDKYCNTKDGRVFACFVDFQKAFDTVIHTGLKIKLLKIGVGHLFYNVIKNMYEISTSCIRIKNNVTDFFPVQLGVKQGDVLSPNLFKIFINDLPKLLENS